MGSIRNKVPVLVVALIVLPGLLVGPAAGAEMGLLIDGEALGTLARFLILEEGPLADNGTDEAVEPEEPPETPEPEEAPDPAEPPEMTDPQEPEEPPATEESPESTGPQESEEPSAPAQPANPGDPVDDPPSSGPDFVVTGLQVPASVPEQSAYEVSFVVENRGDSYAGDIPWEVEFRGDILEGLDRGVIQGLDRGGRATVSVELMADVLVDACDKGSVSVTVDPDESTGDVDYGNNAAEQACEIKGGPEFTLTDLYAPTDVYEGGEVKVLFTVANYGSACTGDVEWEVRIRCNDFVREDVVLTGALDGLGEDKEEVVITTWETSAGDAGEYTIAAVVTTPDDEIDDNEGIGELNVVADGDLPDLAIVDPHIPETLQPGVEFPVVFTVENLGADCEEEFRYDIMYYNEQTGEDIWRGEVIQGLARGESVEITDNWMVFHEGDYCIDIFLDESNRIEELNEDNNNDGIAYHLPAGIAGLYAFGDGVPDTVPVVAGETVPITFSVVNVGEDYDGVIDWIIRIYNDDGDEAELSGTIQGLRWGWDEWTGVETSWEVPPDWSGEYHTVLDLNPNDSPEYVFDPVDNSGTFTVQGADSGDPGANSGLSGSSTPDAVATAGSGGDDGDSAGKNDPDPSPAADSSVKDSGGGGIIAMSVHPVITLAPEEPDSKKELSGNGTGSDEVLAAPENRSAPGADPGSNVSHNETVTFAGDDPETDAWAALWDALDAGDIWRIIEALIDLME